MFQKTMPESTSTFQPEPRPSCTANALFNFRDIADAAPSLVRPGMLFRSATLSHMSPVDVAQLTTLDIQTVIDLRTDEECVFDGVAPQSLTADRFQFSVMKQPWQLLPPDSEARVAQYLQQRYVEMLEQSAPLFVELFDVLARRPGAAIVHCMAGKDRTGLVIALLLEILGADPSEIATDYESSGNAMPHLRDFLVRRFPERSAAIDAQQDILNSSPRDSILGTISYLEARYGGAESYVRLSGLSLTSLHALRRKFRLDY